MKNWMTALAFVAVLGVTALVDAKGNNGGGIHGKISSVGMGSFTITIRSHNKQSTGNTPPQILTVTFDKSTTITGAPNGTIDGTMIGKNVSVVGSSDGKTVTATSITVMTHHKKKAA